MDSSSVTVASKDLSAVSSLYGPGPVLGWLFGALSLLLSWSFSKRDKQQSRCSRISADFLSTILFPLIAIGDLIMQLCHYPGKLAEMTITTDEILQSNIHALEAPLVLIECTMIISVILCMVAIYKGQCDLAMIIGAVDFAGLVIETFLMVKVKMHHCKRPHTNFTRTFLANSVPTIIFAWILTMLPVLHGLESYVLRCLFKLPMANKPSDHGDSQLERGVTSISAKTGYRKLMDSLVAICISSIVWVVFANPAGNAVVFFKSQMQADGQSELPGAFLQALKVFFVELVPRTSNSILDLDQMVSAVAGACLLLLNVWGLVKARIAANINPLGVFHTPSRTSDM